MMRDEPSVSMPMNKIEALILIRSAMIPVRMAPIAYPRSRHSLKTPMLFALSSGWVFSAMEARKVGYTIAVPQPSKLDNAMK